MLRYLPFLLVLAVWIYAFIDVLNTSEKAVRKLPKLAWVFIVLLFGQVLVGPIAWFAVGRPRRNAPYGATRPQERRWVAPDDNPDFLRSLGDERRPGGGKGGRRDEEGRPREEGGRPGDDGVPRKNGGPEEDTPPPAGA